MKYVWVKIRSKIAILRNDFISFLLDMKKNNTAAQAKQNKTLNVNQQLLQILKPRHTQYIAVIDKLLP